MMSDVSAIHVEEHRITTRDNRSLIATLYRPPQNNGAVILIAPAMGVKQTYYRHYASFLAEQGFVTLTFDYRGIGQSLKDNLWSDKAGLLDWGAEDMQAMLSWLLRQYPNHDLFVIGHSIGAKILGLTRSGHRVKGLLGISSANVYWRLWPLYMQPYLFIFWYILLPLSTYAMGYFPSNIFGLGEKLPSGVGKDWSRMARSRYSVLTMYGETKDNHYAAFEGNFTLITFSDDSLIPNSAAADELLDYYPNAKNKHHLRINPATVGQDKIGHLGFFRSKMRDALWQESVDYLLKPQSQNLVEDKETLPSLKPSEAAS